jgi:hypothetical protein
MNLFSSVLAALAFSAPLAAVTAYAQSQPTDLVDACAARVDKKGSACYVGVVQTDRKFQVLYSTTGGHLGSTVDVYATQVQESVPPRPPAELVQNIGNVVVIATNYQDGALWGAKVLESGGPLLTAAFRAVTKR